MEKSHKELAAQVQAGEEQEVEIDLLELFYHIWDHWKIVALCLVLGAVLAGGYTKLLVKPTYEATAKMYVLSSSDSVVNLSDLQLGSYLASDYIEVFKTHEVTNMVINSLGLPYTYEELQEMLTISNPSGTRILNITITSKSPTEAAAVANKYLEVASQYVADVMITDKPTELSVALVPEKKAGPSTMKNAVLGGLVGFVLACGVLVVQFLMDDKVKSGEQITKLTGLPILAEVPVFDLNNQSKLSGAYVRKE